MTPDIFKADGFSLLESTQAINKVPDAARYIGHFDRIGLFRQRPISTTTASVEWLDGVLNLLVSQPRGGPALLNKGGKRKQDSFVVPHFPLDDVILPNEIQNIRAFGSENSAETQAGVLARKLADMRRKHDLTREWLQMGAVKGIIADGDATTIYSMFTKFGVTQKVIDFDTDDANGDMNAKCREVVWHIEDNLKGDMMNGVRCECSRTFYDAFVAHASVKEAFKYFQTTQQLSGDFSKGFVFAGIEFVPFNASTTDPAGTARKFVEDDYAYAYPLGTNETFIEIVAPGNFLDTVNTPGLPYYARIEPRKMNAGLDIHTEMNVLPLCTRPEVLVKIGKDIDD
jgi:hypothetical protein